MKTTVASRERKRAGRPPKYDAAMHTAIVDSLKLGCSRTTAAELAGIDRGTLADWIDRYPAFRHDVTAAIASCKRAASATIRQAILNGDVQSAFRYLALQERSEWADTEQTVNVRHSGSIQRDDLAALTDTEVAALAAIAERVAGGANDGG